MIKIYMQDMNSRAAGCVIYANRTKRFLVPFRSAKVNEPSRWGVWGGKKEPEDKSDLDILYREIKEESGFDIYKSGKFSIEPLIINKNRKFIFVTYLLRIDNEFEPTLNWEHDRAVWFRWGTFPKENLQWGLESVINTLRGMKL